MKLSLLAAALIIGCKIGLSQALYHPVFSQAQINAALGNQFHTLPTKADANQNITPPNPSSAHSLVPLFAKIEELKKSPPKGSQNANLRSANDTVYVGAVNNDTLIITGNYTHTGPIFVFNNGVLIFKNATVLDTGDIYVFQSGKLFADSSSLTFPQQYFYQRGITVIQQGYMLIQNCSFNYSGLSHNLVLGDTAVVIMNNIHQNDWTTCGLFGSPTLTINGCNMGGEYILSGQSSSTFHNVDTLILWHQFSDTAVVNYAFPNGDTVYQYFFNDTVPGISGIGYSVFADSCHDVSWAMMPSNGSDITISNSAIRAIGCWFQNADTANAVGIFDNSSYVNFTAPLSDRNLHLINSSVQTWSLYVFDISHLNIDSCQLGEVGCENSSSALGQNFLLDGSGGYFWATDTSAILASGVTVYSTVRSERNGIFLLQYSWMPFAAPSAIDNGLVICVQNNLTQDPVAYDNGVAWLADILGPDTAHVDSLIPVPGKAWIDRGPQGGWLFFQNYSLYYQLQGDTTWTVIVLDSTGQIYTGSLATWNTLGLIPGNYLLKLSIKDTYGDSVYGLYPVTLLPAVTAVNQISPPSLIVTAFPNPGSDIIYLSNAPVNTPYTITNVLGQQIAKGVTTGVTPAIDISLLPAGVYLINNVRFVKE